jgi:hypothetical protein
VFVPFQELLAAIQACCSYNKAHCGHRYASYSIVLVLKEMQFSCKENTFFWNQKIGRNEAYMHEQSTS